MIHTQAQNIKILRNEMYGNGVGGESGDLGVMYCIDTDGKDSEIAYNRIHDFKYAGIYFDEGSHNFQVHHNVIWDSRSAEPIGIHMNTPSRGNRIYNNTTANCWISVNASYASSDMTQTYIRNNVGDLVPKTIAGTPTGLTIENNIRTNVSYGPPSVDPALVYADYANHDYRLRAGSPAIDAGQNLGFTQDVAGNPIVGAPDIGAYEYVGAPTSYTLTVSATNGSVTKSPEKASYAYQDVVTLQTTRGLPTV
jgi:hypothetical protein